MRESLWCLNSKCFYSENSKYGKMINNDKRCINTNLIGRKNLAKYNKYYAEILC